MRVLRDAVRRHEPLAISAITLLEMAVRFSQGSTRSEVPLHNLLAQLESDPGLLIFPLTVEVAAEAGALGPALRDPVDRALVATARVHGLRLVTSDRRIIESRLAPVVA
jgi:PIN domain nuclease of toxin-antitoxin system